MTKAAKDLKIELDLMKKDYSSYSLLKEELVEAQAQSRETKEKIDAAQIEYKAIKAEI